MKKTITSAALLASAASAFAYIGSVTVPSSQALQGEPVPAGSLVEETRFYCLSVYENTDGGKMLGTCDASHNNKITGVDTDERGCTETQAALVVSKDIIINACPSYAQL